MSELFKAKLLRLLATNSLNYYLTKTDKGFDSFVKKGLGRTRERKKLSRFIGFWLLRRVKKLFKVECMSPRTHLYQNILTDYDLMGYLERAYLLLSDDRSRYKYVDALLFKILGADSYRLTLRNKGYFRERERLKANVISVDKNKSVFCEEFIKLGSIGFDIKLFYNFMGAHALFWLEQYRYKDIVKTEPNDIVIDCGACYGDTALYFASFLTTGKVYAFEFIPSNISIMEENIDLNPSLKDKIEIIKNPIGKTSGEKIYYIDRGPSTKVMDKKPEKFDGESEILCIDDFCDSKKICPSLIKMDIEGSEMSALCGAENTLKKYKPKLMISVYHSFEDMYRITLYIDSLNLGYRFYFDYYTILGTEMILYAKNRW